MKKKLLRKKNVTPKLKLTDLLRRRKMTLKQLLDEYGITTYSSLTIRCDRMGVLPPTHDEFTNVVGTIVVSSPTEGVVVLEPPRVIKDSTGEVVATVDTYFDASTPQLDGSDEPSPEQEAPPVQKKARNKKKESPDE